jgi:hypothetical protein
MNWAQTHLLRIFHWTGLPDGSSTESLSLHARNNDARHGFQASSDLSDELSGRIEAATNAIAPWSTNGQPSTESGDNHRTDDPLPEGCPRNPVTNSDHISSRLRPSRTVICIS